MKTTLRLLLAVLAIVGTRAAEVSINNLPAISTVSTSTVLPVVDVSGTPTTKKATVTQLINGLPVATGSTVGTMSAADKTKLDAATDANTASAIVRRDASGNFTATTITAGTVTGLATPVAGTDAANKSYVDASAAGLTVKQAGRAATTGSNITLSGGAPTTLDGLTLVANDRILVKDQADTTQNGIYYVATLGTGSNGTWTRTTDADTGAELATGTYIFISSGTTNANAAYTMVTQGTITIGSSNIVWALFSQVTSIAASSITGQIIASQIQDAAINTAKFAAGLTPVELLGALPGSGNFAGRMVFLTTDAKLYRYDGANFIATVPTVDLTGTIAEAQIAANAVTAAKIAASAVTTTKIADGSISTPKLVAGSVDTTVLAAGAVLAGNIASGAVTTAKLAALSVEAGNIAANAITAAKIDTDAVTAGAIQAGAVNTSELAAGAVVASKIAAGTITANEIAANTITAGKLSVSDLSAISANLGTVTAGTLSASTSVSVGSGTSAVAISSTGLGIGAGRITFYGDAASPRMRITSATGDSATFSGNNGATPVTLTFSDSGGNAKTTLSKGGLFMDSGTISTFSGAVNLTTGAAITVPSGAAVTLTSGAYLNINSGAYINVGGAIALGTGADMTVSSGTMNIVNSPVAVQGTSRMDFNTGTTLEIDSGAILSVASGGALYGPGTIDLNSDSATTLNISTAYSGTAGALQGYLKVKINGTNKLIPFYDPP